MRNMVLKDELLKCEHSNKSCVLVNKQKFQRAGSTGRPLRLVVVSSSCCCVLLLPLAMNVVDFRESAHTLHKLSSAAFLLVYLFKKICKSLLG